ncbi:MAG: dynamin family protein [Mangrovibacterium sp.]
MSLKDKLTGLLADADRMCGSCPGAVELGVKISDLKKRADQPLRVAVVGIMKAGKSTLMNALVKDKLVFTGNVETTYTVSWFKYGEKPSLRIIFRQTEKERAVGKKPESQTAPFEDLEKWTVRLKAKENPRLKDVAYIEIFYPNEILKTLELIDTPGLSSTYQLDAQNTLDFLGVKSAAEARELEQVTQREASQADAIIYAFTRSAGETDQKLLSQFHGNGLSASSSPINALGVYTRADLSWEPENKLTPVEVTRRITEKTMQHPEMKRLLYTTLPVTAKVIEGIRELTSSERDYLQELASLDQDTIAELIEFVPDFTKKKAEDYTDPEIGKVIGSPEMRSIVEGKVSVYGILEITRLLREGKNHSEILDLLYERSGIKAVNDLITSHFGNRSFVIKTQYIFLYLKEECGKLYRTSEDKTVREICRYILDEIDHIESTEHVFQELKILQDYYNSRFSFNDETEYQEFLQITGETSKNCEAKLGLTTPCLIHEMAGLARDRVKQWHARSNEFGVSCQYEYAAKVIARSYEILLYHLDELSGI